MRENARRQSRSRSRQSREVCARPSSIHRSNASYARGDALACRSTSRHHASRVIVVIVVVVVVAPWPVPRAPSVRAHSSLAPRSAPADQRTARSHRTPSAASRAPMGASSTPRLSCSCLPSSALVGDVALVGVRDNEVYRQRRGGIRRRRHVGAHCARARREATSAHATCVARRASSRAGAERARGRRARARGPI